MTDLQGSSVPTDAEASEAMLEALSKHHLSIVLEPLAAIPENQRSFCTKALLSCVQHHKAVLGILIRATQQDEMPLSEFTKASNRQQDSKY